MPPRSKTNISLPSKLLTRNIADITGTNILTIGLPEPETFLAIQEHFTDAKLTVYQYDYAAYRKIKSLHENTIYQPWYTPKTLHDTAILYLPKSDALIEMMLSLVNNAVQPGGTVYIIGEKHAGIKSSDKDLAKYIGPVTYSDAARHSHIYGAQLTASKISRVGPKNNLDYWEQQYPETVNDVSIEIVSLPGVFSHGRMDDGTRLLLETLELPKTGRILDWGCGAGTIGTYIKKRWPDTTVEMVDSNAIAVEAARRTVLANNLIGTLVYPTDIFSDVPEKYDMIVSNPPFHGGVETDYSMVERFILESYNHIEQHGKMIIVANTFLKYKPLLEKRFKHCKILTDNNRYRVYEVVR